MTVLVILGLGVFVVVVALRCAARVIKAVMRFLEHFTPLHRFLAGLPMDGKLRTDARFFQAPTKALHPTAAGSWWHWRPGWHRSAMRLGTLHLALLLAAGLLFAATLTLAILASLVAAGFLVLCWHVCYKAHNWNHERHHVRPLERTLTAALGTAPVSLEIERDGDVVKSVAIEWAPETEIRAEEQDKVLQAVTTRLALEAPDPAWKLRGRNRSVVFTQSEPVRSDVSWEDVEDAVMSAAPDELVFGIGKRGAIVKAKYSESPHIAIPGGSGGGKSNLAAFLLLQELHRGSLVFNLDPKWISHLWLQDLPNVINCHDIPDLHLALTWLGGELVRRTKAAYYSAAGTGRVRGKPGDRIIAQCEELNYGMPGLKDLLGRDHRPEQETPQGGPGSEPAEEIPGHSGPVGDVLRRPRLRHPRDAHRPAAHRRVDRRQGFHDPHQRRHQGHGPLGRPRMGYGRRQAHRDASADHHPRPDTASNRRRGAGNPGPLPPPGRQGRGSRREGRPVGAGRSPRAAPWR